MPRVLLPGQVLGTGEPRELLTPMLLSEVRPTLAY